MNDDIIEETQSPSLEDSVVPEESSQENSSVQPEEKPQQRNFKALKEAKAQIERERDELMRRLQEQERSRPTTQEPLVNPDDLVEARYVDAKLKKLEEQLSSYQQQTHTMAIEARLKAQYGDFDSVVSKDNLDILKTSHPEIFATLQASSDLYSKAVSAYKLIKQFGITSEDEYAPDKEIARTNSTKPRPSASISPQKGQSPLTQVNGFVTDYKPTKAYQDQLYREMIEAMKKG